jgi:pimeloyl-ACP methyl ester carboxylesterase
VLTVRSVLTPAVPDGRADIQIVCLPGAYHSAEDFLTAGFADCVRRRGLSIDLLLVDAELEHLGDRRFRHQLSREILSPARARGYRTIWLAGISLGGFMALDYVASNPDGVHGVCLLAPYLGNRLLIAEIARARGLAAWMPGELAEIDEERRIWRFVQARCAASPPLYLGYGGEDRFVAAHRLMAGALPRGAVNVVPGGHDWGTWTILWENFLDSGFV